MLVGNSFSAGTTNDQLGDSPDSSFDWGGFFSGLATAGASIATAVNGTQTGTYYNPYTGTYQPYYSQGVQQPGILGASGLGIGSLLLIGVAAYLVFRR